MTPLHICAFAFVGTLGFEAFAAPTPQTKSPTPTAQAAPASQTLRSADEARDELFGDLETRISVPLAVPAYPTEGLLRWIYRRHQEAEKTKDAKAMLQAVGEELRLAQNLLREKIPARQRAGVRIALINAAFAAGSLRNARLTSQIYEGFLLPHLNLAHAERWQDLSRQRLLEGAIGAFKTTKETQKETAALRLLLAMNEDGSLDLNTLDWARGELAQRLAAQKQYEEALTLLRSITAPGMQGVKKLIPRYEAALEKQKTPATASPQTP